MTRRHLLARVRRIREIADDPIIRSEPEYVRRVVVQALEELAAELEKARPRERKGARR